MTTPTTPSKFKSVALWLLALLAITVALVAVFWNSLVPVVVTGINIVRHWGAPAGTLVIEQSANSARTAVSASAAASSSANHKWLSYNRTLTSERFSALALINTETVKQLAVLCSYDAGERTSFETGPIVVEGALIAPTEHDIFSLNPATCAVNWRTHDFKTGKRLWEVTVAEPALGKSTPSAPIAWNELVMASWHNKSGMLGGMAPIAASLVFGDMGGNFYALNGATGERLWGQKIGGAIGGGVITHTVAGAQKIAVASSFPSILWPPEVATTKIVILGLKPAPSPS